MGSLSKTWNFYSGTVMVTVQDYFTYKDFCSNQSLQYSILPPAGAKWCPHLVRDNRTLMSRATPFLLCYLITVYPRHWKGLCTSALSKTWTWNFFLHLSWSWLWFKYGYRRAEFVSFQMAHCDRMRRNSAGRIQTPTRACSLAHSHTHTIFICISW